MVQPLAAMRSQRVSVRRVGCQTALARILWGKLRSERPLIVEDVEGVELRVGARGGSALAEVDGFGPCPAGAELEAAAEAAAGFEDERVVGCVGVGDDGGDGAEACVDALSVEGSDEGFAVAHAGCAGSALKLKGFGGGGGGDVDVDGVRGAGGRGSSDRLRWRRCRLRNSRSMVRLPCWTIGRRKRRSKTAAEVVVVTAEGGVVR